MTRVFVPPGAWQQDRLLVPPDESHHLLHVLRLRPGAEVTAFDGKGRTVACTIADSSARDAAHLLPSDVRFSPAPTPPITLAQAIPKGDRMDSIVQKAVELGASAILPVVSERVVKRPAPGRVADRWTKRLERIAAGAAAQCGIDWIPDIQPPMPLSDAMPLCAGHGLFLVPSLDPERPTFIRDVLAPLQAAPPASAAVLIGPEGDLSPQELDAALRAGGVPVSLGARVLRTDTAAVYAMSVLQYALRGGI